MLTATKTRTRTKSAPARTRARVRANRTIGVAPRSHFSQEEIARLLAEGQRLCDETPIGGFFICPLTGLTQLKTLPFTEEDVYATY